MICFIINYILDSINLLRQHHPLRERQKSLSAQKPVAVSNLKLQSEISRFLVNSNSCSSVPEAGRSQRVLFFRLSTFGILLLPEAGHLLPPKLPSNGTFTRRINVPENRAGEAK